PCRSSLPENKGVSRDSSSRSPDINACLLVAMLVLLSEHLVMTLLLLADRFPLATELLSNLRNLPFWIRGCNLWATFSREDEECGPRIQTTAISRGWMKE